MYGILQNRLAYNAAGTSGPNEKKAEASVRGVAANKEMALTNENSRRASSGARMMQKAGNNLTEIAEHLNNQGFKTSRGCSFQAVQVKRLLERVGVN